MNLRIKRRLQMFTSFLCVLVLMSTSLPTLADGIDEVEGQTLDLQSQLAEIDQELLDLTEEIYNTEKLIEQTNGAIIRSEHSLAEAKVNRDSQKDNMAMRIRFIYEGGNVSLIESLLSAESIADFLNKAEFIQAMGTLDREMLIALQEALDAIELHQEDLIFQQNALQNIKDDLEEKQEELTALAEETATDLEYLLELLDQLRTEEALRLQAEAERVAAELAAAAAAAPPPVVYSPAPYNPGGGNGGGGNDNYQPPVQQPPVQQPPVSVPADDVTLFAALLEAEAFQNYNYLLAVATAIMGRVADPRFPSTLRGVIFQPGQFGPVTNGSLDRILARGPTALSIQVANDALGGSRHPQLTSAHVFFNHAGASSEPGINIGGNVFWTFWPNW